MTAPTIQEIRELFDYDPATGLLRWRVSRSNCIKVGQAAGLRQNGHLRMNIGHKYYYVHRVIWAHVYGEWPTQEIDHINGDPTDNRIANLRLAVRRQNIRNSRRRSDNTSGFKGVTLDRRRGHWIAQISCDGDYHWLGSFKTPEAAHAAYAEAAKKYHGEFARAED